MDQIAWYGVMCFCVFACSCEFVCVDEDGLLDLEKKRKKAELKVAADHLSLSRSLSHSVCVAFTTPKEWSYIHYITTSKQRGPPIIIPHHRLT